MNGWTFSPNPCKWGKSHHHHHHHHSDSDIISVSWWFEPSHPQGIVLGLESDINLKFDELPYFSLNLCREFVLKYFCQL